MSSANAHVRNGFGAVRAYVYGPLDLLDFVTQVFEAEELERGETPGGLHVDVKIGDSVMDLELGELPAEATHSSVYVYVPDVDAAYRRALQAGAISLAEPGDKPYLDRNAGVRDSFGNIWWIGTYQGTH
jgi:PhnB protein